MECMARVASLRTLGHGAALGPGPREPKQAALLLDHRRRICVVEFLVAKVDQVRAGRRTRPYVERRQKPALTLLLPLPRPLQRRPAHVETRPFFDRLHSIRRPTYTMHRHDT